MSPSPVVHLPQSKPGTIQGSHLDWKTWKKWEGIFKSGKSQRILNKLEKSGKIKQNTGKLKEFQTNVIYYFLVIFKLTLHYMLKWIKFLV